MNGLGGFVVVAEGGTAPLGTVKPGSAAHDFAWAGFVGGDGPFGHIAVHVVEPPGVRLETAHGRGHPPGIVIAGVGGPPGRQRVGHVGVINRMVGGV